MRYVYRDSARELRRVKKCHVLRSLMKRGRLASNRSLKKGGAR